MNYSNIYVSYFRSWNLDGIITKNIAVLNSSVHKTDRSSRPEVFCKKDVPRNFAQFTGKRVSVAAYGLQLY